MHLITKAIHQIRKKGHSISEKENEALKGVHNNEGPGMLIFDFGEHLPFSIGRASQMPEAGDIVMFPSWLRHYVSAFKSEGERISVSGNITLCQQ